MTWFVLFSTRDTSNEEVSKRWTHVGAQKRENVRTGAVVPESKQSDNQPCESRFGLALLSEEEEEAQSMHAGVNARSLLQGVLSIVWYPSLLSLGTVV